MVPSFARRLCPVRTKAHTEALTKLPWEALNESPQSLSFLNPDILN